jgi:hypothetical protein
MSEFGIRRRCRYVDVQVATDAAASTAIGAEHYAAATVHVSGVTASATFAIHASANGTQYLPAYGPDGTPSTVAIPATGGAVFLPPVVAGLAHMKLVTSAALGTAARVLVTLKS